MVAKIFKKIILENVGGIFRVFLKYEKNDSGTMGDFKNKPAPFLLLFTILSDFHHGSTPHRRQQRGKRKREHDAKDGKHQKLKEHRKSEGKELPDADNKTGKKILHKQKIHRENIAPTVRVGHINPRGKTASI